MRKFWQRKPKPPTFDVSAALERNAAMQAQIPALVGMALKLMIQILTTPAPRPVVIGNMWIVQTRLLALKQLALKLKAQEATFAQLATKGGNHD